MSLRDHKYLRTKSYHPSTMANRRRAWEAEQMAASRQNRVEARKAQLQAGLFCSCFSFIQKSIDLN